MPMNGSIIPTFVFIFLSWTVSDASAKESFTYVGSSTVGRFMHDAAKEYAGASFSINTKPESGGGENAVAAGKADIGGVAREVSPAILAKGVHKHYIGKDAIGIWVNSKNPVTDLSMAQLKAIFTGKTTNWKDVGGTDMAINVYIVNPQSATRKVFKKAVLGEDSYAGFRLKTVRPDPAIIERIKSDAGGIGQLSFALGTEDNTVKRVNPGGESATFDNPNYPIGRPLYLITKGPPAGLVKSFIDWAHSEEGQEVVKRYFIGL